MTNGYGCAFGDESHQVNWLITRLRPAVTISLCDDDFPVGLIPLLASELGVDQGRFYEAVKQFADAEQAREDAEADQVPSDAADAAGPADLDPPDDEDPWTDYGKDDADELNTRLASEGEATP